MTKQHQHWTDYWASDRISACLADETGNYDPCIGNLWQTFYQSFDTGSRFLDIGTGNGAVPLLGIHIARQQQKEFSVTGIDVAPIDPQKFLADQNPDIQLIEFHGNTTAEKLPFDSDSFEGITAQYAIEYTELTESLAGVKRVLKKDGKARFIIHAKEGVTYHNALQHRSHTQLLMKPGNILENAESLIRDLEAERGTANPGVLLQKHELLPVIRQFVQTTCGRFPADQLPLVYHNLFGVLQHLLANWNRVPLHQLLAKVDELKRAVHAHDSRLSDLIECAMDRNDIKQFELQIEQSGLRLEMSEAVSRKTDEKQLAWLVDALG